MTKEKMHQNAEERLELLHTITEIVNIEVDKRMDIFTANEQQVKQIPPAGKCPVGRWLRAFATRFRKKNNRKNNINLSRGYTVGAEARDTNKH